MATASAPSSPAKVARQEAFVEAQLHRAVRRIRAFDLLAAGFSLLSGALAFGLVIMLLDRWLELSALVRGAAFAGFAVLAGLYLLLALVRPLLRQVNPYYAAVQVEQTLPGAKNSLVSWLDLRERPLPPAIRSAVGLKAARDLGQVPLEQAITGKRTWRLGGVALVLLAATALVVAVLGPTQFLSLWKRAFASYAFETAIASQTRLEVVLPEGGHATVPVGQSVNFLVRVGGRIPKPDAADAVTLQFRYTATEPYQERRLLRGDRDEEWVYRLAALEVQHGFLYRIVGGDTATPEYQVQARSGPVLTGFDVTYRPRKYVRQPDQRSNDPNLTGLRGTEVTLTAHTNRAIKEGRLLLEATRELLTAERVQADEQAMRFRLVLDKPGTYRLRFLTQDNEPSGDSVPYTIQVAPDQAPVVVLTQPTEEMVSLPANGTLPVQATAQDDHGIAEVQLRVQLQAGPLLKAKPYAPAKFRFEDGGCPTAHAYQELLDLDKLQKENGERFEPKPGDVLDYWLEATDNCDYPRPNVGKSQVHKIKVEKPAASPDQQKARDQAQAQQKQHEQKVEQQRQEENERRKEEAQKQANQQKQDQQPKQDGKGPADQQPKQDQQLQEQLDKLQKEADKQPGESKPQPSADAKGQQKDAGKQEGKEPGQQPQPAEQKPTPQPGQNGKEQGGEAKPQPQAGDQGQQGESKGQGEPPPQQGAGKEGDKAEAKPQPKSGGGASAQKGSENKSGVKPGDAKPQGTGQNPSDQPGSTHSESQPTSQAEKGTGHGEGKNAKASQDDRPATGEAKGAASSPPGASKGTAAEQPKGQPQPGQAKDDTKGQQQAGTPKPSSQAKTEGTATAKGRPEEGKTPPKDKATLEDIAQAAQDLRSGDPQKQAEADRALQQASKNADDPKVREAARDALQKADSQAKGGKAPEQPEPKEPRGSTPGSTGQNPKEKPGGDPTTANSTKTAGKNEPKQPAGGDKTGDPTTKEGDPKQLGKGTNGKGKEPGDNPPAEGPAQGTPGNAPGGAERAGERRPDQPPGAGTEPEPGSPADLANKKRAAELQLERWEELKGKLTPDMLKKAGMTEEELKRFDQAYRDGLKRQIATGREQLPPPQTGNATIQGSGPRRVETTGAKAQDVQNAGQTQAPSEFRGAYEEFTRELSKIKGAGKK